MKSRKGYFYWRIITALFVPIISGRHWTYMVNNQRKWKPWRLSGEDGKMDGGQHGKKPIHGPFMENTALCSVERINVQFKLVKSVMDHFAWMLTHLATFCITYVNAGLLRDEILILAFLIVGDLPTQDLSGIHLSWWFIVGMLVHNINVICLQQTNDYANHLKEMGDGKMHLLPYDFPAEYDLDRQGCFSDIHELSHWLLSVFCIWAKDLITMNKTICFPSLMTVYRKRVCITGNSCDSDNDTVW